MIRDLNLKDPGAIVLSLNALDYGDYFPHSKITAMPKRNFSVERFVIYLRINEENVIRFNRYHGGLKISAEIAIPELFRSVSIFDYSSDAHWVGTYKDVAVKAIALFSHAVDVEIAYLSAKSDLSPIIETQQLEKLWRLKLGL
jgi:hypothetical protein